MQRAIGRGETQDGAAMGGSSSPSRNTSTTTTTNTMCQQGGVKPRNRRRNQTVAFKFVLFVLVAACLINETLIQTYPTTTMVEILDAIKRRTSQTSSSSASDGMLSASSAHELVQNAFNETYRHLVQDCQPPEALVRCMKRLHASNETNIVFPWWFRTLLKRGSDGKSGLHGPWHSMSCANPDVRMCTMEKIGTTEWRRVFFRLNGGYGKFKPDRNKPQPRDDAPRFVFVRDPLERFLSAYIDKCIRNKNQNHCEPNVIFNNKEPKLELLGGDVIKHGKELFAAYVDTMPLTWNLHFFPQGLYCDGLYRDIANYTFVGRAGGPAFYRDLHHIARRIGGRFRKTVHAVFNVPKYLNDTTVRVSGGGHATGATSLVDEYYTPRSVRRVLEYVSIDYVMLGLPIPEWAEQMLASE